MFASFTAVSISRFEGPLETFTPGWVDLEFALEVE